MQVVWQLRTCWYPLLLAWRRNPTGWIPAGCPLRATNKDFPPYLESLLVPQSIKMTPSRSNSRKKDIQKKSTSGGSTWDERIIHGLLPWRRELLGLVLFILAMITLLGLVGLTRSGLLELWTGSVRQAAGWAVFPLFLIFAALGIYQLIRRL